MGASAGVLIGLLGLLGLGASFFWLVFNSHKRIPLKIPAILLAASFFLCIIGYLLTPTGTANIQLILRNIFR